VLGDDDLVDAVALGDDLVQTAVARRADVSAGLSGALAEIAGPEALMSLLDNPGAMLGTRSLARIVERHGGEGAVREALLARADLPIEIRQAVAAALARDLSAFVADCGWLSPERSARATCDAREKTTVALSALAHDGDLQRLAAHLRWSAQLTPALILRALLSGAAPFAAAALAELSGLHFDRVAGLMRDGRGAGFAALCRKAGLPPSLTPAFEAALAALRAAPAETTGAGPQLSRALVGRALSAYADDREAGHVTALLRRYDVEAARDEARGLAGVLADEAALASLLSRMPALLEERLFSDRALAA
jgi:uncharacterized protein (DUF2336 family)